VPEIKDQPAVARLFAYPNLSEPVASKKMFRANDANFLWSPKVTLSPCARNTVFMRRRV